MKRKIRSMLAVVLALAVLACWPSDGLDTQGKATPNPLLKTAHATQPPLMGVPDTNNITGPDAQGNFTIGVWSSAPPPVYLIYVEITISHEALQEVGLQCSPDPILMAFFDDDGDGVYEAATNGS